MPATRRILEQFDVKDLEDGSKISVVVEECSELGNQSKPGVQIMAMGQYVTYEPLAVEKWAYQAGKQGVNTYLLEDKSWMVHQDQYIKHSLVLGSPPKARIEVKTRSRKEPVVKEYPLPFEIEM